MIRSWLAHDLVIVSSWLSHAKLMAKLMVMLWPLLVTYVYSNVAVQGLLKCDYNNSLMFQTSCIFVYTELSNWKNAQVTFPVTYLWRLSEDREIPKLLKLPTSKIATLFKNFSQICIFRLKIVYCLSRNSKAECKEFPKLIP